MNQNLKVLMGITLTFMVLSILYQVMIGVMYQKMIQATDMMTGQDNKLLKQCKERFITCYQMNNGVPNVAVFVDKYINRIRVMGMSTTMMKHISGQLMLAGVFVAGIGACKGIVDGTHFMELVPFYIVSLFGIYTYLSVSSFVDMPGKRQTLKINLTDYLENHIARRIELGFQDMQSISRDTAPLKKPENTISKLFNKEKTQKKKELLSEVEKETFTEEDARELEELLRSFMV